MQLDAEEVWAGSDAGYNVTVLEDGETSVTPTAMSWTLLDGAGNVVEALEDQAVDANDLGDPTLIKIPAAATALIDATREWELRRLVVTATYTSSLLGSGSVQKGVVEFRVRNAEK